MSEKNTKVDLINKRYNYLAMETEAVYHDASVKLGDRRNSGRVFSGGNQ